MGSGQVTKTHPQHVVHQGATTRPDLDQLDAAGGAALGHPLSDEPDAAQLAKDLGDLGRGDKVALEAELVAVGAEGARVVAANVGRQTHAHVAGEGDGAGCLWGMSARIVIVINDGGNRGETDFNGSAQLGGERCRPPTPLCRGGRLVAMLNIVGLLAQLCRGGGGREDAVLCWRGAADAGGRASCQTRPPRTSCGCDGAAQGPRQGCIETTDSSTRRSLSKNRGRLHGGAMGTSQRPERRGPHVARFPRSRGQVWPVGKAGRGWMPILYNKFS